MVETIAKIRDLIQPVFDQNSVYLLDVALRGQRGSHVLSVYADTRQGISLEQITVLTRGINALLDVNDVIPGKFRLEVSSPGVDRNLQEAWEFEKHIGRTLKVRFQTEDQLEEVVGKLVTATPAAIMLTRNKQEKTIPTNAILEARVQLKW